MLKGLFYSLFKRKSFMKNNIQNVKGNDVLMEINLRLLEKFLKGEMYILCNNKEELRIITDYIERYQLAPNLFFMEVSKNSFGQLCLLPCGIKTSKYLRYFDLFTEDKEYKASEIIYMIENGTLNENDNIIDKQGTIYSLTQWDLNGLVKTAPYTIKKNDSKYVTFEEAINSNKKIKYKNGDFFTDVQHIMGWLRHYSNEMIKNMLKEKAWLIKEN